MATFGQMGNKITKQLGIYETGLNSTEPDIKATSERMVPRLKLAMQKLMQGQEIFKAQRAKKDILAGKGEEYMEKNHGESWKKYGGLSNYQDGGSNNKDTEPTYASLLDYESLAKLNEIDNYDNMIYKSTTGETRFKPPPSIGKQAYAVTNRANKILELMSEKYPDANKEFTPEQLEEAGFANEYYDLHNYRTKYNEVKGKITGTSGEDEYGQGDDTPLRDQIIGEQHGNYFGGYRGVEIPSEEDAAEMERIDDDTQDKLKSNQYGDYIGGNPMDDGISGQGPDIVDNAVVGAYNWANNPNFLTKYSGLDYLWDNFDVEEKTKRDHDAMMEASLYAGGNSPASIRERESNILRERIMGSGGEKPITNNPLNSFGEGNPLDSFGELKTNPYLPQEQQQIQRETTIKTQAKETADLQEKALESSKEIKKVNPSVRTTKEGYVRPTSLKKNADLRNFQEFAYEQDKFILGKTGVDSQYGKMTAGAWQKYGAMWNTMKKNGDDPVEQLLITRTLPKEGKHSVLPVVSDIPLSELLPEQSTNPYLPSTGSVLDGIDPWTPKTAFGRGLLKVIESLPQKDADQIAIMEGKRARRTKARNNRKDNRYKNSEDYVMANFLDINPSTATRRQKKLVRKISNDASKIYEKEQEEEARRKQITEKQIADYEAMDQGFMEPRFEPPLEYNAPYNENVVPAYDMYSQENPGGHYRDADSMPVFRNGGSLSSHQWGGIEGEGAYTPEDNTGGFSEGTYDGEESAYDWNSSANGDNNYDFSSDEGGYSTPDSSSNKFDLNNTLKVLTNLGIGAGKGVADHNALDQVNQGPLEYADYAVNPMLEPFIQKLNKAEGMQKEAWDKAGEKRDFKIRPFIVDAKKEHASNMKQAKQAKGPLRHLLTQMSSARLNDKLTKHRTTEQNTEANWNNPSQEAGLKSSIAAQNANIAGQYNAAGQSLADTYNMGEDMYLKTNAVGESLAAADVTNMQNYMQMQELMSNQQLADSKYMNMLIESAQYKGTKDALDS